MDDALTSRGLAAEPDLMSDEEFKAWIEKYRDEVDRIARKMLFPESDAADGDQRDHS